MINSENRFLLSAIQKDDVEEASLHWAEIYSNNNFLVIRQLLIYAVNWGAERTLFELIKKNYFMENEFIDDNLINQLIKVCEERNYFLSETLLRMFASGYLNMQVDEGSMALFTLLFILIAEDKSLSNSERISLMNKLEKQGIDTDAIFFNVIDEDSEEIFKLIEKVYSNKNILITKKIKERAAENSNDAVCKLQALDKVTTESIILLNELFEQKNYLSALKLMAKTPVDVLVQFYHEIICNNDYNAALLSFLWGYSLFKRDDFYEKILDKLSLNELSDKKNKFFSKRVLIDYLELNSGIKVNVDIFLPDLTTLTETIQIALELDKRNALRFCLKTLEENESQKSQPCIQGLLKINSPGLQLRLVKYLKQFGHVYKQIDSDDIRKNHENNKEMFSEDGSLFLSIFIWQEISDYLTLVDQRAFAATCLYFKTIIDNDVSFLKTINIQNDIQKVLDKIEEASNPMFSQPSSFWRYPRLPIYRWIPWAPIAKVFDYLWPITGVTVSSIFMFTPILNSELKSSSSQNLDSSLDILPPVFAFLVSGAYMFGRCIFRLTDNEKSKLLRTQLRGFKELFKLLEETGFMQFKNISKNMLLKDLEPVIKQLEDEVDELENQHPDYYTREMKQLFFSNTKQPLIYEVEVSVDSSGLESENENNSDEETPLVPGRQRSYGGIQ